MDTSGVIKSFTLGGRGWAFVGVGILVLFPWQRLAGQPVQPLDDNGKPTVRSPQELMTKDNVELERLVMDESQPLELRCYAARLLGERGDVRSLLSLHRAEQQLDNKIKAGEPREVLFVFHDPKQHALYTLSCAIRAAIMSIEVSEARTWEDKLRMVEAVLAKPVKNHSHEQATRQSRAHARAVCYLKQLRITDENEAAIIGLLDSSVAEVRYAALDCMGHTKRDRIRTAVEGHLDARNGVVDCLRALTVLGRIGSEKSVAKLRRVAFDIDLDASVRIAAGEVLWQLGNLGPEVLKMIEETEDSWLAARAYFSRIFEINRAGAGAIARLGAEVLEGALAKESDESRQLWFREALQYLGDIEALFGAVRSDDFDMARKLLAKNIDPTARGLVGATPLHIAIENENKTMTWVLLKSPVVSGGYANLNRRNVVGKTVLHLASENGRSKVVEFLIAKGADINARDNAGKTPLDCAKTDEMKALLRKHGAKSGREIK